MQLRQVDLHRSVARQRSDNEETHRYCVRHQTAACEGFEFRLRRRLRGHARFHRGDRTLPEPRIGYTNHGGIGNLRVLSKHVSDLLREHLEPAAIYRAVCAATQIEEAVLIY